MYQEYYHVLECMYGAICMVAWSTLSSQWKDDHVLERGGWAGLLLQCDCVWQVLNKWECSRLARQVRMAERQQRQRLRALQNNRQLARFVLEGRATGKQLGTGSYGSVEEV